MRLGEKIYKLRVKKKWSQGDLAEALGVSRQSVSKWETNASVPELDKLVKLCQLFSISLDDLVSENIENDESKPDELQPEIYYVERPIRLNFSIAQVLGTVLLFCSLLCLILLICLDRQKDLFEILMLCLPVTMCGFLCMITHHPLLWCSWCASAAWWIYTLLLAAKWESEVLLLAVGVLLVLLSLLYTVHLYRRQRIKVPVWLWLLMISFLTAAAFLLLVNLIPPETYSVEYTTQISPETDVSIVTK